MPYSSVSTLRDPETTWYLEVLTKYHDLLPDQHKRMIEDEKLKISREKLEMDKVKVSGEGDADEELINDWVGAVMDDGSDDSGEKGVVDSRHSRSGYRHIERNRLYSLERFFSFEPDGWQAETVQDLADHPRVSIRSGQGVG
jgi:hypothetical protein